MYLILGRISPILESARSSFQAGFREGPRCSDWILVLWYLIFTSKSSWCPLYLLFLDLEKAYDSVSHLHLWWTLMDIRVPIEYVKML